MLDKKMNYDNLKFWFTFYGKTQCIMSIGNEVKNSSADLVVGIAVLAGISVLILGALFCLPLIVIMIGAEIGFIAAVFILNLILPSLPFIVGFVFGIGGFGTLLVLSVMWVFILARAIVDLVVRFPIFFNIVFQALVIVYYYFWFFAPTGVQTAKHITQSSPDADAYPLDFTTCFWGFVLCYAILTIGGFIRKMCK